MYVEITYSSSATSDWNGTPVAALISTRVRVRDPRLA